MKYMYVDFQTATLISLRTDTGLNLASDKLPGTCVMCIQCIYCTAILKFQNEKVGSKLGTELQLQPVIIPLYAGII